MAVPRYDRRALTPAVVHMSVGYFHRSHQAVYLDSLAGLGHTGWGLTGVGLRRREMSRALEPQDCMWTVVERGADGDHARVIGVMGRYLFAPDDPRGVRRTLADPRTRLVTLTVTGAAYHVDPTTGMFDADDEDISAEVAGTGGPRSALGLIVEALDDRRRAGLPPFTVLSCDNMPANGEVTRRAITSFAGLRDPQLAAWLEEHGAFPSSMVDRITPKTTDADRVMLERKFGVRDRWPVITEPFTDWVIEDAFSAGRPPLDEVGVRFVSDVRPYSLLKTRLLNASHLVLGALGQVAGFRTIDRVMRDPVLAAYADRLTEVEIAPSLPVPPGVDLDAYRESLLDRMANPTIADQVSRLCRGGSLKYPRHVLPSLLAAREDRRPHPLLTLATAAVCRQLRGVDDAGHAFRLDDPVAARLQKLALRGGSDPRPLLSETSMFGRLGRDEAFVQQLSTVLRTMDEVGMRGAVVQALSTGELATA